MIVVVGAGPAGLSVAWQLTRQGHAVTVVEASPHVGGMAGSRTVSGVRVDLGSHRLHPAMPAAVRTAVEELVELQERPRHGRIRLAGRWLPFPFGPLGLVRGLGTSLSARAALGVTAAGARRDESSYAGVIRSSHGTPMLEHFHGPYARKIWGVDPEELTADLAHRRMGTSATEVLRGAVATFGRTPTFLYPRTGFGALSEAMATRAGDLRLGTKVTGLIEHPDRVIVGLGDGRILSADHVFSTLPVTRTASWLGAVDPDDVAVPVRAMVLVYLTLDRRPYTEFDAHYLPDPAVLPSRVSEPTNYRASDEDPVDRTVLCAEIPCWLDDPVWRADDRELGARVADDLVRTGLPDPRPVAVETVRLPSVYPVMTASASAAVARAESAMAGSSRVTVLGRQGLFTPDNTHHVLEMGFAAASCLGDDGVFDHDAWRIARDRFRGFTVED